MTIDLLKKHAALSALSYINQRFPSGGVVGIGTGSTVNFFIKALAEYKTIWSSAVSSSRASSSLLQDIGIKVIPLNEVLNTQNCLDVYIDGADEVTKEGLMIKGGGAALTQEKIIASASKEFICIVHCSKYVKILGNFPLPVEIIPMASNFVIRSITNIFPGSIINLRIDALTSNETLTDNGCQILDIKNISLQHPDIVEAQITAIAGVVSVGLFSQRRADILFLASEQGIEKIKT